MNLQAPKGKVIVQVDTQGKNSHRFSFGLTIRLERQYNNLNRRETEPVNAMVMAAERLPAGAEVLIHHNSLHAVNEVNNYKPLSGEAIASSIKYYSIPEEECFVWRLSEEDEWQPTKNFATALRVFEPYKGLLSGIEPKKLKNILYVTSGELSGEVIQCAHASDYEIVFQDKGQESRLIRFRHFEDEVHLREEALAVLPTLGEMVKKGELWVGLSPSDCGPLNP